MLTEKTANDIDLKKSKKMVDSEIITRHNCFPDKENSLCNSIYQASLFLQVLFEKREKAVVVMTTTAMVIAPQKNSKSQIKPLAKKCDL